MDNEADKPGSNSILGQGAFKQVLRARWKALVVQERLSIAFAVVGSVVILLAGTGGFASEEVRAAGPSQSIPGIIGGVALVLLAGGSYFQPWRRGASRDLLRCERKLRAREAEPIFELIKQNSR